MIYRNLECHPGNLKEFILIEKKLFVVMLCIIQYKYGPIVLNFYFSRVDEWSDVDTLSIYYRGNNDIQIITDSGGH